MKQKTEYTDKFNKISQQTLFTALNAEQQTFLRNKAFQHRLTLQELQQISEITRDLHIWNEPPIQQVWPADDDSGHSRTHKKDILRHLTSHWNSLKTELKNYAKFDASTKPESRKITFTDREKGPLGLGSCPVASERTRCCNLLTLDTVENCGFDCSYCSIQSFYHGDEIHFDPHFAEKLTALKLDPNKTYHIGTGQSSDSLMWGNRQGMLDALIKFARENPNLSLELKSKSKNIAYLLRQDIPKNIICTWSLNPQVIIDNEEHLAASLDERINAAKQLAEKGTLVGFHFHPIIHYENWQADYSKIFNILLETFDTNQVALISFGTLTFIKPVLKKIRNREFKSKILQMPLINSDGKLSYPDEIKLEIFKHAYQGLAPWHKQVFFYLCMENQRLWEPVFGYSYATNAEFETAMKDSYFQKIQAKTQA